MKYHIQKSMLFSLYIYIYIYIYCTYETQLILEKYIVFKIEKPSERG